MNVSSETLAYPTHPPHRFAYNNTCSPMLTSTSPVAVRNKIRAIQTRKPRISLQSYYDFTDIRPINIGSANGVRNSATAISNLSAEKSLERNREPRLGRIPTRHNVRASFVSTVTTTNQQSLFWPTYNSSMGFAKQSQANSPTISPTALAPTTNRPSASKTPDIQVRFSRVHTTTRQPLIEQQNTLIAVEPRRKSQPKNKSSIPKAYHRAISKGKSSFPTSHTQPIQKSTNDDPKRSDYINNVLKSIPLCKSEEDDGDFPIMDDEFEEYLAKAMVKCADWLIKYVFDRKYDEDDG